MSVTNPPSPTADPHEAHHLGPKARSRSKSTSSSVGQPRAVIAPRHEKFIRDQSGHLGQASLLLRDRHAVRRNDKHHRALCQFGVASRRRGRWKLDQRNPSFQANRSPP
ncbi:hypothetical protein BHM03_00054976 [Ensete ventricosum]|nr:hypothetical protein BHM03_00054976 [Ensete ventricosum]